MASELPASIVCPRCSLPLRSVGVSTPGPDDSTTVHAVCDRCATQWTYPHWDPVDRPAHAHRPVVVTEWSGSNQGTT
jgi:hypothetical protein